MIIRRLAVAFVFVLIFLPVISQAEPPSLAPFPAATPAVDEKARFDYALGLYLQGSFDTAVEELRGYLKDFPKGEHADDALYWLGKRRMAEGEFAAARAEFQQAITDFPSSDMAASIQFELGFCWYAPDNPDRDLEKAFAEFMKVPFFHQDSPVVPQALYYAAKCQMESGKPAKARDNFSGLALKYPDSPYAAPALYSLGLAYLIDGNDSDALSAFQTVRDRYPAGLYKDNALAAMELIARGAGKKGLTAGSAFGAKGNLPGQLSKPAFIAIGPEGEIYAADTGNARVQRLQFDGGEIKTASAGIQVQPERPYQISRPVGVASGGPRDLVYITDSALHRVLVYSRGGKLIASFGNRGPKPGEMDSPAGIAVTGTGKIYLCDRGNRRVSEFGPDFSFRKSFEAREAGMKSPLGVAVGLKGEVLVTDDSADKIFVFSSEGKLTDVLVERPGLVIDAPYGICVDGAGNIYVACRGGRDVIMFDRNHKFVSNFPGKGVKLFDSPAGIAAAPDGTVFVIDSGLNRIVTLK